MINRSAASLSPNYRYLAVSNLQHQFDVYDLETNIPVRPVPFTIEGEKVNHYGYVPVLVIHDGEALLGASHSGTAMVWDIKNGDILAILNHQSEYFSEAETSNPLICSITKARD
jgi:WD40 repeat protein